MEVIQSHNSLDLTLQQQHGLSDPPQWWNDMLSSACDNIDLEESGS